MELWKAVAVAKKEELEILRPIYVRAIHHQKIAPSVKPPDAPTE